jgi:hypothetical protein
MPKKQDGNKISTRGIGMQKQTIVGQLPRGRQCGSYPGNAFEEISFRIGSKAAFRTEKHPDWS